MAKIILFVDALEPREIGGTRFEETMDGYVESGAPKVTPKVTSEVQTGMTPSETGFGGQHTHTGQRRRRPHAPTLAEKFDRAGLSVTSMMMPYCHPLHIGGGMFVSDTMNGPQPGPAQMSHLMLPFPAAGDLMESDDDGGLAYNARADDLAARCSTLLNVIRQANIDVAFIGIRSPDQYTHFQWHEDHRVELLKDIAYQVERFEVNHDVFWWSDHGSEEKQETFRVNKWLTEKGYLDIDVDMQFHERFVEEMDERRPQSNDREIENTLGVMAPGVELQASSEAVCTDPYDSCLTYLDDDVDAAALQADLMETGYYDYVRPVEDEWGDGPALAECPDLVTHRADNVLVTSNVHPEPIGMGYYRSGVHSARGAWGTTDEFVPSVAPGEAVSPVQLHDLIWEWVTGDRAMAEGVQREMAELEQQMQQAFSD